MPDAKSTYLDSAVAEVDAALKTPSLSTDQRRALLGYLVDLQAARNDPAGGDQAYEELAKLPNADVDDPNIRRVMAERKLTVASRALDAKHYQDAIDQVMSNRASFTEPNQQAEALWIVAEARRATAGNDPDALKDAALAYMRVVLAGKDSPAAAARVAQSLAQAAELCERAGDDAGALQLDEQLLAQYPSDPAASTARQNVQRLAKSKSR